MKKLRKPVRDVLDRLGAGDVLCRQNRVDQNGVPYHFYFFTPSGRGCPLEAAELTIAAGLLKPSGDCLFDGVPPQTWGLP